MSGKPDQRSLVDLERRKDTAGSMPDPPQASPEGGRNGWLAVLGCWTVMFYTFGYVNAFGIYEAYYLAGPLKHCSPSAISWIGSVQFFMLFFSGLISGPIADRYGSRVLIWPFSILFVVALMLTSICKKYYQFLLSQGIFGGLCMGFVYSPALAVVGHYFRVKRPQAMGIASSGSALGGIILSTMVDRLLNHTTIGFGWTQRVVGFLLLLLCLISCATLRPGVEPRVGTYLLPEAFNHPTYTLQVLGLLLITLSIFTPFFYLPTYAQLHGTSVQMSWYLIATLNAGSFFGRLGVGAASARAGQFNMLFLGCGVSSILIFCWLRITSTAGLIVFSILFGLSSGAVIGLIPATIAHTAPVPNKIGTYTGMALGILGIGGLTGTPITGAMIARYHTYTQAIIFSGVVSMAGAVIILSARICYTRKGTNKSLFV